MTLAGRRFAATLIAEYVIAENQRRGVQMTYGDQVLIRTEAMQVAEHLDESGALAT